MNKVPDWIDENGNIMITVESLEHVSAFLHNVNVEFIFDDLDYNESKDVEMVSFVLWRLAKGLE